MQTVSRTISFALGPTIIGLWLALTAILLFPEKFPLLSFLSRTDAPNSNSSENKFVSSYADAVKRAAPSVVNIYTMREQPINGQRRRRFGSSSSRVLPTTGSGVIISDKEGYILTNLHVVEWAVEIRVALQDGRETEPEIVGFSVDDDMAVLKINLDNLQSVEIGNPDAVQVGDVVLAIGNPVGVGQTVTQGIISATRRKGLNITHHENFLQTDAAINPGNSGGALVDAKGRLLGINIGELRQTFYGEASGIGFAIPVDRALQALREIIEYGRGVRGWLGVSALDLNPRIIEALQLENGKGVLVTDIFQGGPADIAGLIAGDIIKAINNTTVSSMSDATEKLSAMHPREIVIIDIVRAGQSLQLEAVLSAVPEQ